MRSRSTTTRAAPAAGGEYLFWLGRMSADKGPVTAIEVARAAGMPMLLAGKLRGAAEQTYFEEEVEPLLGGGIAYVGEIDLEERVRLLHGARALDQPAGLGRAVRARDGRGHGLRRTGDRHAARLGARDRGRRGHRVDRGERRGHGCGGRALRGDRPARVPCRGRAALLARAHGRRLRGRVPSA